MFTQKIDLEVAFAGVLFVGLVSGQSCSYRSLAWQEIWGQNPWLLVYIWDEPPRK